VSIICALVKIEVTTLKISLTMAQELPGVGMIISNHVDSPITFIARVIFISGIFHVLI